MIYFIQSGKSPIVKIGYCAGHPKTRLGRLQIGNPEKLTLVATLEGSQSDERGWHRRYAHLRVRGEWFRLVDDLLEALKPHMAPDEPPYDQGKVMLDLISGRWNHILYPKPRQKRKAA